MIKKPWIFHPLLFAVYPVLFMLSHNIAELSTRVVKSPLIITLIFFSLLWLSLFFIQKDRYKRGLIISLFFLLFFSYGHILNFLFKGKDSPIFFLVYIIIPIALIFLIIKTKKNLVNFTKILNYISLFLVFFSIFNIIYYEIRFRSKTITLNQDTADISFTQKDQTKYPDIYYIIFDRYTSSKNLKNFLGFDNSDIEKFLESKDFVISRKCLANYPYTFLSLASSLNMEYLNYLYELAGPNSTDRTPVHDLIQNNKVVKYLKVLGYKYYHLGSWWGPTRTSKKADQNFTFPGKINLDLDEFSFKLFKTTLVYSAVLNFFPDLFFQPDLKDKANIDANRILYKFDQFKHLPYKRGPKFVFAHFLTTHPPYYFDKSGNRLSLDQQLRTKEKNNSKELKLYLESIEFTNHKIKELVENILSSSSKPPIIIMHSDEGPVIDWGKKRFIGKYLRMRTGIFCALYMPDIPKETLGKIVTPVNIFRQVFNNYFGTSLPLLKNIIYKYNNKNDLYSFTNITKIVRKKYKRKKRMGKKNKKGEKTDG